MNGSQQKQPKKRKRIIFPGTIPILVAVILGTFYFVTVSKGIYGTVHEARESGETAAILGTGLASLLVTPHVFLAGFGTLFSWLALFFKRLPGFALAAGILFCIAAFVFPMYAVFVIVQAVFSFIGYGRRKKGLRKERE